MKRAFLILCFAALPSAPAAAATQGSGFNPFTLTDAGRMSYLELREARAFAIGNIWGRLSSGQRALHQLLKEEKAAEACRGLIRDGSPAGRLYGFLGLRFLDASAFSVEAERYQSRLPAEGSGGGAEGHGEKVVFQSGCAQWSSQVMRGVSEIEKGEYDDEFRWGAEENDESPQHNSGMHPTANQPSFYLELAANHVESAAGDAWR